jgi:hypothetical protein
LNPAVLSVLPSLQHEGEAIAEIIICFSIVLSIKWHMNGPDKERAGDLIPHAASGPKAAAMVTVYSGILVH